MVFKVLFEYGLKKLFLFGGVCYFWLFIEEVVGWEVERDFVFVYFCLVFCKIFRLDEDGKVLILEELFYWVV